MMGSTFKFIQFLKIFIFVLFIYFLWLCQVLNVVLWDLVPRPGIEPGPLNWECRVLASGAPEKSLLQLLSQLQLLLSTGPIAHRTEPDINI